MRKIKEILLTVFCMLCLSGCAGRELEDREFPTVLTVPTGNLESLQDMRQSDSRKFLDYSHTKAVIFHEDVAEDWEKLGKALNYLEIHPEFAKNMLVFIGGDEELKKASEKKDKVGSELADYYKNQPGSEEKNSVTLTELWNYWSNEEEEISVPTVKVSGKSLAPEGTKKLKKNTED